MALSILACCVTGKAREIREGREALSALNVYDYIQVNIFISNK